MIKAGAQYFVLCIPDLLKINFWQGQNTKFLYVEIFLKASLTSLLSYYAETNLYLVMSMSVHPTQNVL